MKKLLYILLLFPVIGFSQVYQSMPQYGYGPIKRMQFDSVATLPLGLGDLRQSVGFRNIGQVRFNTTDSSLYVWTGFTWAKQAGGGSGGSQTWQQTLAQGNVATTLPVINRSFLSSVLRFTNPANNRQVDILPGTGSDSLRTLTLPNKGGRIALWTPRTQCINDSLFAWDESGVRQFTGTLCVTSQGSAIVRAHNGLEVLGDSSVGIRQGAYGTNTQIYFNPISGAFSAGTVPRLLSEGQASIAFGSGNTASGDFSAALGANNIASGVASIASGNITTASGTASVAMGGANNASGDYSVAMGESNTASGTASVAIGGYNTASGNQSVALGHYVQNPNAASLVVGDYNDPANNVTNDVVFQVARTLANRFEVRGNGQLLINDGTQQAGYVLTSDANGVTSWQPPSGGGADSSVFFTNFRADTARRNYYNTFIKTGDDASLRSLHVTGTNGAGNLLLRHQANPSTATGQTSALFADNNGNLAWQNANLSRLTFTANHFTANHAIRFQNKNYTVADSAVVLNRADSNLYVTPHDYNVGKDSVLSLLDTRATSANNNGLTTKVWARGQAMESITTTLNLVSGTHQTTYFDLSAPTTLNGVRWFQTVQGSYTANNFNGFAIYRYDAVNDTAYLVAQTANTGTIWQATANTWNTIDFTAPVNVQAGPYRIVAYYSSSAQTTAPALGSFNTVQNAAVFNLPNTGRLSGRLTQTTPANFKTSTLAAQAGQPIIGIY
jgi:hypothetical protein